MLDVVLLPDIKEPNIPMKGENKGHAPEKIFAVASDIATIIPTSNSKNVTVDIADNGSGIAPEDAKHLFERFYKADKSRTSKGSGAGLGLSIAKHLVELHEGSLTLVPSDIGARFRVTLNK